METVEIRDDSIRLGQLLKLSGIVEDGAMAKQLIADGQVSVDGRTETRRGATIHPGATVELMGESFTVARA
ncbi:RNA-binding S4 domain-containing protein [Brevibacterium sp. 50QC2O2]|jgi:ribosome-associated protein|uniref:RNA-binding S4 domain-containing protein n=1 Tax=Brevibacterium TaxID=1696 RepID=UPI00211BF901|nr:MULTISPECIES: RNA-binding S4 domain-containing protein [unclassified Brevibacterium]MCQ9369080.1 RNA-binding S4 domain-containing protein [Brevibacterium sp. 91QC2O2]MCQ9385056.1 RNA-binding S4 domain-containing protein [Brevibacterium sp. 68QC2CO]MCQ9387754.1 RNA-binding S4 domain-containing protein [Brevibacterium sp. 50QC2O2]